MKLLQIVQAGLFGVVLVGALAACQKNGDEPGPAEKLGRNLDQATDKAGRDLT